MHLGKGGQTQMMHLPKKKFKCHQQRNSEAHLIARGKMLGNLNLLESQASKCSFIKKKIRKIFLFESSQIYQKFKMKYSLGELNI